MRQALSALSSVCVSAGAEGSSQPATSDEPTRSLPDSRSRCAAGQWPRRWPRFFEPCLSGCRVAGARGLDARIRNCSCDVCEPPRLHGPFSSFLSRSHRGSGRLPESRLSRCRLSRSMLIRLMHNTRRPTCNKLHATSASPQDYCIVTASSPQAPEARRHSRWERWPQARPHSRAARSPGPAVGRPG